MQKLDIPLEAKSFFAYTYFCNKQTNVLLLLPDEESSISAYYQLKFFDNDNNNILYFPSLDTIPYDRISPGTSVLANRAGILTKLALGTKKHLVVTAAENFIKKLPTPDIFSSATIALNVGMEFTTNQLIKFLIKNGFTRSASAFDSGTFAVHGEIIDIITNDNKGYRIVFTWESIESIREFNPTSQISKLKVNNITLYPVTETLINADTIIHFKQNFLKNFGVNHIDNPMYESIMSGNKFYGYEHLMPLFYQDTCLLLDFLGQHKVIYDNLCLQSIAEYEHSYNDFYKSRLSSNRVNPDSFYFAIKPEDQICEINQAKKLLGTDTNILINSVNSNDFTVIDNIAKSAKVANKSEFELLFNIIVKYKNRIPIIFCSSLSSIERFKQIAKDYEYSTIEINNFVEAKKNLINLTIAPLKKSFLSKEFLFISELDILSNKFTINRKTTSRKKLENILDELNHSSEGELVVHKEHGIGMFEKIQTMYLDKVAHDCLKIIYANHDILYLPVENIDQIKKHSNSHAELDKLGSTNWQKRKSKLKNRIKDIADKLMQVTAKRALSITTPVKYDLDEYDKFANKFTYNETEDQLSAIEDIKNDLTSGTLMDRLVCGDVGFGKTEVAIRAAFMVVHDINDDKPQIAIITPTTILTTQHFNNFIERFRSTSIKTVQLSRLIKSNIAKETRLDIRSGKVNIIIGTHSLLSSKIQFKNLRMIIIDEEQHFGVSQKEFLKQLKTDIHVLSLSATPIPRTLQMSMVGIKDLSLITTPPIDRLPIRTTIIPFDEIIIRDALLREKSRGGVSFYVAPRVKDIEWIAKQLAKFVPELTFKIAHGQMPATEIDNTMHDFSEGKFDILLSTTIIESGINIPIANTMIIHRSDMLGLSQLYQLRGRVGRGNIRGFTYLTLLSDKKISKHSRQRLEILQDINSLGAGFTIASHDMDLRGFGNLVGDEQAGHIKEVGSELYQEMLDQAIDELKHHQKETKTVEFSPSINLNIPVLIPEKYIEDSSLRLSIYRRAGNLKNHQELELFKDEMIDRFGILPTEFNNLLNMVEIKNICLELKILSLDSGPNGFVIKFHPNFDVSNFVINFIQKYPKQTKIKPENKLIFLIKLKPKLILEEIRLLLTKLIETNSTL